MPLKRVLWSVMALCGRTSSSKIMDPEGVPNACCQCSRCMWQDLLINDGGLCMSSKCVHRSVVMLCSCTTCTNTHSCMRSADVLCCILSTASAHMKIIDLHWCSYSSDTAAHMKIIDLHWCSYSSDTAAVFKWQSPMPKYVQGIYFLAPLPLVRHNTIQHSTALSFEMH